MSAPVVDADGNPAEVERMLASIGALVLWVVAPVAIAWGSALFFLDLDSPTPQPGAAWAAIAWYVALALLVLVTGLANRYADAAIGVTVVLVAIEFVMVSLVTAVLWPLAVLDRHPFLGAATDVLRPTGDLGQSVERWLSSAMTGYPVLIALVITILRAVARRQGWNGRTERRVLYISFVALVLAGVAVTIAIMVLKH